MYKDKTVIVTHPLFSKIKRVIKTSNNIHKPVAEKFIERASNKIFKDNKQHINSLQCISLKYIINSYIKDLKREKGWY